MRAVNDLLKKSDKKVLAKVHRKVFINSLNINSIHKDPIMAALLAADKAVLEYAIHSKHQPKSINDIITEDMKNKVHYGNKKTKIVLKHKKRLSIEQMKIIEDAIEQVNKQEAKNPIGFKSNGHDNSDN